MKKYLVSTGSIPLAISDKFTDYKVIPSVISKLDIDGVEFVFLPEWNDINSPLTPTSAQWNETEKPSTTELTDFLINNNVKVYSVHLNRDIGNYLCSNDLLMINRGLSILDQNLQAATKLKAKISVLHLWDTFSEKVDIIDLYNKVYNVSRNYQIAITIENIPVSDKSQTLNKVWGILDKIMPSNYGFTLDLNWCSLYNNFKEIFEFKNRIYNIHVQGKISSINNQIKITPRVGELDFNSCLEIINQSNYSNFITLELHQPNRIDDFIKGLNIIKNNYKNL